VLISSQTQSHRKRRVRSVAFSPDGTMLANGSDDSTVNLWNTNTVDCESTLHVDSGVNVVTWNPDAKALARGKDDNTVRIWGASLDK
jgi:WD40 repeat protein